MDNGPRVTGSACNDYNDCNAALPPANAAPGVQRPALPTVTAITLSQSARLAREMHWLRVMNHLSGRVPLARPRAPHSLPPGTPARAAGSPAGGLIFFC